MRTNVIVVATVLVLVAVVVVGRLRRLRRLRALCGDAAVERHCPRLQDHTP
jgi:hypothetical protein